MNSSSQSRSRETAHPINSRSRRSAGSLWRIVFLSGLLLIVAAGVVITLVRPGAIGIGGTNVADGGSGDGVLLDGWRRRWHPPGKPTESNPTSSPTPGTTPSPTGTPTTSPTASPTTPTTTTKPPTTGPASPRPGAGCATGANAGQCGYPSSSNAGVPAGTALTNQSVPMSTGLVIRTDNTVVNALNLSGWIDVQANNVTIQNSVITSNNWWGIKVANGKSGLKVLHTTLKSIPGKGPDNGGYDYGITGSGYMEIGFSDISGFKDGVDIESGIVHDSVIHDLSQFSGAHTQSIYVWCEGSGVILRHNTLVNQTGQQYTTAAIYIAPDCGHQNNVTVDNNWMAGGSFVFYGGDSSATNIRVTNNVFSTEVFSPKGGFNGTVAYWWGGNSGNVFSGNTWANGPSAGKAVTA